MWRDSARMDTSAHNERAAVIGFASRLTFVYSRLANAARRDDDEPRLTDRRAPVKLCLVAGVALLRRLTGGSESGTRGGKPISPPMTAAQGALAFFEKLYIVAEYDEEAGQLVAHVGSDELTEPYKILLEKRLVPQLKRATRQLSSANAEDGSSEPPSGAVSIFVKLAERAGFEPAMEFNPHTRLAGECLQPLGHLSKCSEGQCKASGSGGASLCGGANRRSICAAPRGARVEGWQSG
jgi:hypothetical protein